MRTLTSTKPLSQAARAKTETPFAGVKANLEDTDPKFPDTILISMNKRDKTVFDVYRLKLKTGTATLDTKNPGNVQPSMSAACSLIP